MITEGSWTPYTIEQLGTLEGPTVCSPMAGVAARKSRMMETVERTAEAFL